MGAEQGQMSLHLVVLAWTNRSDTGSRWYDLSKEFVGSVLLLVGKDQPQMVRVRL